MEKTDGRKHHAPGRKYYKGTHGHSKCVDGRPSRTFMSWTKMWYRVNNPNHKYYTSYGGRGITVCERWNVFENFLSDMGERPTGKSLDRIDNTKGYSPDNCRWATPKEQCRNRKSTRFITVNGQTKSAAEWSELSGVKYDTILSRLNRGWVGERVISL